MRVKKNKSDDINKLASAIVAKVTTQSASTKNPHAVALGRLGGLRGGKARAQKLSSSRRKAIAKKAAETRWKNS